MPMARAMKLAVASLAAVVVAGTAQVQAVVIVHTSDFINDANRSHFNGFELIPNDGVFFTGGGGPYTEDTVQVRQINGDAGNDMWVSNSFWTGFQGSFGWYPNGGDFGYTTVGLAGGVDFQDVGFNYGSGSPTAPQILYELLDNGAVVLAGAEALNVSGLNYLGFSGGGFDTIRMRDTATGANFVVTGGSFQTLTLDNIETQGSVTPVPEPPPLVLCGIGMVGVAVRAARRRRQQKQTAYNNSASWK